MHIHTETDCTEAAIIEAATKSASKKENIVDQSTNEGYFSWAWEKLQEGYTLNAGVDTKPDSIKPDFFMDGGKVFADYGNGTPFEILVFGLDEIESRKWRIVETAEKRPATERFKARNFAWAKRQLDNGETVAVPHRSCKLFMNNGQLFRRWEHIKKLEKSSHFFFNEISSNDWYKDE
jgi:hypothetical protein